MQRENKMSFPAKVKKLFEKLKEQGKFTPGLAEHLCDIRYCNKHELQTEFPVFRQRGMSEFDDTGKNRRYYPYYKFNFKIGDREYIFTNNWFSKNAEAIQKFFDIHLNTLIVREILYEQHHTSINNKSVSNHQLKTVLENKKIQNWPDWEVPSSEDIKKIACLLTPYLKFLHPEIVAKITASNKELESYFHDYLSESGIDANLYIWEKCSTMFPGIRRANGKTDNEYKKKQLPKELRAEKGAIYIDDNSYPKHIWAFIFTAQQFSNIGPKGYELAHIFEHKAVERIQHELINNSNSTYDINTPLSGMFTSAASLIYSPRTFVKITDHSLQARRLVQRRALQLYQNTT
ncbi:MAG: hypothetical protein NTU74_11385, partial [Deltaproteobacteria bacterium]|nr:hypothetical protein [Deltaproteobacteria bacterium]